MVNVSQTIQQLQLFVQQFAKKTPQTLKAETETLR